MSNIDTAIETLRREHYNEDEGESERERGFRAGWNAAMRRAQDIVAAPASDEPDALPPVPTDFDDAATSERKAFDLSDGAE